MLIFSVRNIDGANSKAIKRTAIWKFDARIPQEFQILKEIYADEAKGYVSRGHMTRRQDPNWGTKAITSIADAETFHTTNAAPQVQNFNAGLWKCIEDFILNNTQSDKMRVSVFTGPICSNDDPVAEGIKIPVRCLEVVALLPDRTAGFTATGYVDSQAKAVAGLQPTFAISDFENQQHWQQLKS